MYTGIIYYTGTVRKIKKAPEGGLRLSIGVDAEFMSHVKEGGSINVDGVCLTALLPTKDSFEADVMTQTLRKTTLGNLKEGSIVNLEASLRVGDEIGGHYMYGHVSGVGEVTELKEEGNALILTVKPNTELIKYFVNQGSVGVHGISLTVAETTNETFTVSLIPETLELTNLSQIRVGDRLNIEVDMMIKYLEKLTAKS